MNTSPDSARPAPRRRPVPRDQARVLLIGLGGLGCPAALVLRDAGVRHLTLIDGDRVDASNLHRQVLYTTDDAQAGGRLKAHAAAAALGQDRDDLVLTPMAVRLGDRDLFEHVRGFDLVLDGTDHPHTKFQLNDACVQAAVPLIHAGCVRWQGQVLSVIPGGPCLRCLFEDEPPAQGLSCAEQGVVGPVVGVVGALQAEAALAVLDGRSRGGELVLYDGRQGTCRILHLKKRRAGCPACLAAPAPAGTQWLVSQEERHMALVRIPTSLRKLTQGKEEVAATGATIGALLAHLEQQFPGLKERICDDTGAIRRFVNVFVNDEDIRFMKNLDTVVNDKDEVSIVPAIAGGAGDR